jgi:hypothetical protein
MAVIGGTRACPRIRADRSLAETSGLIGGGRIAPVGAKNVRTPHMRAGPAGRRGRLASSARRQRRALVDRFVRRVLVSACTRPAGCALRRPDRGVTGSCSASACSCARVGLSLRGSWRTRSEVYGGSVCAHTGADENLVSAMPDRRPRDAGRLPAPGTCRRQSLKPSHPEPKRSV